MASLAPINTARLCDRRRACFACRAFTRREHLWGLGYCAAAAWSSKAASEPRMFSAMRMEPSQNALVDLLKREGYVRSARIEEAMRACDRRLYLPQGRSASAAYIDTPQLIGQGETISAPSMHSECLELLNEQLHPGAVVLDVGSGALLLHSITVGLPGPRTVQHTYLLSASAGRSPRSLPHCPCRFGVAETRNSVPCPPPKKPPHLQGLGT